jgi:hypothetical protein
MSGIGTSGGEAGIQGDGVRDGRGERSEVVYAPCRKMSKSGTRFLSQRGKYDKVKCSELVPSIRRHPTVGAYAACNLLAPARAAEGPMCTQKLH